MDRAVENNREVRESSSVLRNKTMPNKINSQTTAVNLYAMQNTYGERLKTFRSSRSVQQAQKDEVTISENAQAIYQAEKRGSERKVALTYPNPRVDNLHLKNTFKTEPVTG